MSQKHDKVEELRNALKKRKQHEAKGKKEDVSSDSKVTSDLEEQLKKAQEDAKKHYEQVLRVMAEFENYKKRTSKEQSEQAKFANENIVTDLLDVLDDFERVEDHIPEDAPPAAKAIGDGVLLIHKSLQKVLDKYGLKKVEIKDTNFDPAVHEALAYVPSEDHASGEIIEVHRNGYKLNDRLLRPVQVTVSKGSE